MQTTANRFSFVSASLALMVTYVTSSVPIPLYGTYQLHDHVSYWQLSLSSVVYFIGAVTALVLLGRLSNHWGRKPVALLSLMLAALSVAVFVNVHSAPPLIVGRFCCKDCRAGWHLQLWLPGWSITPVPCLAGFLLQSSVAGQ
ncbi:MFS transporter [Vibrio fluvialis]